MVCNRILGHFKGSSSDTWLCSGEKEGVEVDQASNSGQGSVELQVSSNHFHLGNRSWPDS